MEEVKKKRGRPKKEGSKTKKFQLKMTEEQFEKLTRTAELSGKSKTDVILIGLELCETMTNCGSKLDL